MADTTFVDYTTPAITAEWLNAVNDFYYTLFAGATTAAGARTAIGLVAGGSGDIWVEKAGDTMTGQLTLTYGAPRIDLYDNDTDANKAIWSLTHSNGTLTFQTRLDSGSFQENTLTFNRSGANASDITSIVPFFLSSGTPQLKLIETDASANNGVWSFKADTENLYLQTLNDAESAGNSILEVNRTAEAIDAVKIGANATSVTAKGSEVITEADYIKAVGNITTPIYDLNSTAGFALSVGVAGTSITRGSTATYCDRQGTLQVAAVDAPRFEKAGLLVEGASTNRVTYSEDITHANWLGAATPTGNTDVAPDGTTTADTIADVSAVAFEELHQTISGLTVTDRNCVSVFVKKDSTPRTTRFCKLRLQYSGSTTELNDMNFDTSTGEFLLANAGTPTSGMTGNVEDFNNSWWRVWIENESQDAANTTVNIYFYPAIGADSGWVTDVTVTGSAIVWGFQIEALPFPSSYIPTTTAAVTRLADIINFSTANVPSKYAPLNEISVIIDFDIIGYTGSQQRFWSFEGDTYRTMYVDSNETLKVSYGAGINTLAPIVANTKYRAGMTMDGSVLKVYLDGVSLNSAAYSVPSGAITGANIGSGGSSLQLYGHVSRLRIYDKALTDAEMRIA